MLVAVKLKAFADLAPKAGVLAAANENALLEAPNPAEGPKAGVLAEPKLGMVGAPNADVLEAPKAGVLALPKLGVL